VDAMGAGGTVLRYRIPSDGPNPKSWDYVWRSNGWEM